MSPWLALVSVAFAIKRWPENNGQVGGQLARPTQVRLVVGHCLCHEPLTKASSAHPKPASHSSASHWLGSELTCRCHHHDHLSILPVSRRDSTRIRSHHRLN